MPCEEGKTIMARDPNVETFLDEHGLGWQYVPTLTLGDVDRKRSLANQARPFVQIDPSMVERYAQAMKHGADFPALVVYKHKARFVIMGGNHRLAAADQIGRPTFDAYVVTPHSTRSIEVATWGLNYLEGVAPGAQEARAHALRLMEEHGFTATAAARYVGMSPSYVQTIRREARMRERLRRCGWSGRSLGKSIVLALNSIRSDERLRATFPLLDIAARVSPAHLTPLLSAIAEAESITATEELVADAVPRLIESAGLTRRTARPTSSPRSQLRVHLGGLRKVVSTTPATALDFDDLRETVELCLAVAEWAETGLPKEQSRG